MRDFPPLLSVYQRYHIASTAKPSYKILKITIIYTSMFHHTSIPDKHCAYTGYSGASLLFVCAITRATVVSPHPGESSWRQGRAESGDSCQDGLPLHHKQKHCPDRLIHCDHTTSRKYQESASSELKGNGSK